MSSCRSRRLVLAAGLAAALALPSARADERPWPGARPITWLVGYVPGGSVDVLTRTLARALSERLGQSIVVDNKPGASGALALQAAAKAAPDGYTLLTVPGPLVQSARLPQIGQGLSAIALMAQGPIVLVGAPANAPAHLPELIAAMKKTPDQWSYASSGIGTAQHLAGELFNSQAGTAMVHIPYKGGGQAVTDLVSGQTRLGLLGVTPVLPHIQAGRLRAYAVTTPFRVPSLPDVPTMDEAGLKGYEATQYFVAAAPAGVDPKIVARLNAAIAEATKAPEVAQALGAAGLVAATLSPAQSEAFVLRSLAKFDAVAKKAHITLE